QRTLIRTLTLSRWRHRRRLRSFMERVGEKATDTRMEAFRDALALETRLRDLRAKIDNAKLKLRIARSDPAPLPALRHEIDVLIGLLRSVRTATAAALACPRPDDAERMAKSESPTSFAELTRDFEEAIERSISRRACRDALNRLSNWMEPSWIATCEAGIAR